MQASRTFAAKLGLTPAQLARFPGLLQAITRYHIILGAKVTNATQLKVGSTTELTADPVWNVTIIKAANGSVSVRDVQGNVGRITKPDVAAGKIVIRTVDTVLLSGDVFLSAYNALSFYQSVSTLKGLVDRAGLKQTLSNPRLNATMFAPINRALNASLGTANLTNVLKYHLVPGARTIPSDWVSGKPVETLYKGHTLSVAYRM